jgi:DNA-directed RNA polymerase specialized sigma24 family protein
MGIPNMAWDLPDRTDLGSWMKFQKSASDEELIVITFVKILGFSEKDISTALNVSAGTVRYRVGKAVRQIGAQT